MEVLTTEEVAGFLKVSPSTVKRMVRAGMPCFRIGRAVRFRKDRIQSYLERISNERHPLMRRGGRL